MRVDGAGGGFEGREAVVIVKRVEQLDVEDRFGSQPGGLSVHGIFVGFRPAARAGNNPRAVRPQANEFADSAIQQRGFDIGIAGNHQVRDNVLDQLAPGLRRVGPRQQCGERMRGLLGAIHIGQQRQSTCRFRNHAHAAIAHSIGGKPLLRLSRIIPRAPLRAVKRLYGDDWRSGKFLLFPRKEGFQVLEHV